MACMQGSPDAKKPCKGILKTSSSFDKHTISPGASSLHNHRKSAKFDEINVLQTYHPPDKDYGHMKIDEPKTPYNYVDSEDSVDQLDAELLVEKLRVAVTRTASCDSEDSSEEEIRETEEEKKKRLEFEKRRKAHYNEFEAVRLARKLIEEEDDEDEDHEVDHNVDDDNDDDDDDDDDDNDNNVNVIDNKSRNVHQKSNAGIDDDEGVDCVPIVDDSKSKESSTDKCKSSSSIVDKIKVDQENDEEKMETNLQQTNI